jgi:ribosomal protein S18 acetylase RimI-like enzyme
MGPYVEVLWGWDDVVQQAFFDRFLAAGHVWVVMSEKTPVGAVQWHEQDDHLFLAHIEVLPAYQGLGIGTEVIRSLQETARERNLPLKLQVLNINPRANALYARLGFVADGETETHTEMTWCAR